MKKQRHISMFLLLFSLSAHAQQEAANWYFGENAGIKFKPGGALPVSTGQIMYNEGVSSISDCRRNLLFYTDGVTVWNVEHGIMTNGMGLLGHYSATQGSLIVPHPGNCDLFYLFTLDGKEHGFANGMMYSMIDMSLQNGLGAVISKNNPLYAPSSEKMTAVRHSDGQSVWVITHEIFESNIFHSYLVTTAGLDTVPVLSETGAPYNTLDALGQMKASPDGKRIAAAHLYPELVEIFDFDPATGKISNPVAIPETVFDKSSLYGLEFSPNGSLLYVANHSIDYLNESGSLYQFNLEAGNAQDIVNSGIVVGENAPLTDMRGLQLGPDGKLYVSRSLGKYLGVVNHPDKMGISCGYVDEGIFLDGKIAGWTLPNFMVSYFAEGQETLFKSDFSVEGACHDEPTFFNSKMNSANTVYYWNFGDGTVSALPNPVHTFLDTGSYLVSLIAVRNCCADTSSQLVKIGFCFEEKVYIPTAFSPNKDGINDEFKIYGKGIREINLRIYDRWGELVFETKDPLSGWEGTFKGRKLNSGVFTYMVAVTFENGAQQQHAGDISLLK